MMRLHARGAVEDAQPQWIRDLWHNNAAVGKSSAYFQRLTHNIELLQASVQDNCGAETLRRDSVLAGDVNNQSAIDSYWGLRQFPDSSAQEPTLTTDNLSRLEQHLRSWAGSFMAEPNYFTVDQTDFTYLCRTLIDGDILEPQHRTLLWQIESTRLQFIQLCATDLQPSTLRGIIALRILEISEKSDCLREPYNPTLTHVDSLQPIPASILDVVLSPGEIGTIEQILPWMSNSQTREFYGGICIKTCAFCQRPKFRVLNDDVYPILQNLAEFPQEFPGEDCVYHDKVCSSCRLEWLIQDICQDWWHNLNSSVWLTACCHLCYQSKKPLVGVCDIKAYLAQLNNADTGELRRCLKMYQQVLRYRHTLQELSPRPSRPARDLARRLLSRFIDNGLLDNFIQLDDRMKQSGSAECMMATLEYESLKAAPDPEIQIPIFPNLFRGRINFKECIVCAEDKLATEHGSWSQWNSICAGIRGLWNGTIIQYPHSQHQQCSHTLDVCQQCIAKYIAVHLENGVFEKIPCPQCERSLSHDEIKNLCLEEDFKKYDRLVLLHTLSKLPNFRWCLSPQCENGQIYDNVDPTFPAVECQECNLTMCYSHERPWHHGLTCNEFDSLLAYGDPDYLATQANIEQNTKGCPNCGVRIEKGPGCFHMTCSSCRHEFCWECLVSWDLVNRDHSNHLLGCYFRSGGLAPTQIVGTDLRTALNERQ